MSGQCLAIRGVVGGGPDFLSDESQFEMCFGQREV